MCVCVCVGVRVSHKPESPLLSFFLHEPMIPLGTVQNTCTDNLLFVLYVPSPCAPHNRRHWHGFSYGQLISAQTQKHQPTGADGHIPIFPASRAHAIDVYVSWSDRAGDTTAPVCLDPYITKGLMLSYIVGNALLILRFQPE